MVNMNFKRKIVIQAAGVAVAIAAFFTIPISICRLGTAKWIDGNLETQQRFADGVTRIVLSTEVSTSDFRTGNSQFNGEWAFGTYQMAGIGYAQMAIEHPELRGNNTALTMKCIERLLSKEIRAFDSATWGEDPIDGIDGANDHASYLGYFNFLLGLHRLASDDKTYAELNDRITASLIRHLSASRISLLYSYPGEIYPVDNCFVIGSIGLHRKVTGQDHSAVINRWSDFARKHYVDPKTKLLFQTINPLDGAPADEPRGSGTALGLFPLHYADPVLAEELYEGVKSSLAGTWAGFGVVREYPKSYSGKGDIDSGPVIFGYGLSATGFTIAGAMRYNDKDFMSRLLATARLFGAPVERGNRYEYVSGGPLGNAILFAMMTTPKGKATDSGGSR